MSLIAMRRKMRYALPIFVYIFVAIFIIGAFAMFNPFSTGPGGVPQGEQLFARIDGKSISNAEFGARLEQEREQARAFASYGGQPVTIHQLAETPVFAYQRILQEYAEAAAAEAAGVKIAYGEAQAEVNRQVKEQVEQYGKGSTAQEKAEIEHILRQRADVESVRRYLLSQRLREKLNQEARPVEVQVAHILVKAENRTPQDALKLAQSLASQARAGADFAKLVAQHSQDEGSKGKGGVVGWASAMPPAPSTDPKTKPDPEAATQFVPEFTAAALRLKSGQVSDPVQSQFGFHVLKALKERDYQPAEKDPKKRDEAIQSYRTAVANQMAEGLVSQQRQRLEAAVVPHSPWLKGYFAEQAALQAPPAPQDKDARSDPASSEAARLAPAIEGYATALKTGDPTTSPALAFKLAQLYGRAGRHEEALEVLQKWARRSGDAELFYLQGETLEKLNRKTEALESYQGALDKAYNNPGVLMRLAEKLKGLGRKDLARQAETKQAQQLARQAEERKRQEEEFKRRMAEAEAAEKKASAKVSTREEAPVAEVTVKTGDIDPKTGKPKILSVTRTDGKGADAAEQKPAGEGAPTPAAGKGAPKP